ncbi:PREDICTED: protein phosphatase methylesterase 1 [Nicrophorus vespilloides]|uniref:Protein phosphatase methylesterase 1 n=1 Tax=Nicrophorus vespilloides TaxID=110193 RepID=A0ABM1MA96_NICVS|nr:PREDICTED: protein phosphatase methylesterase 1 [Nicrophorus vespilloides]
MSNLRKTVLGGRSYKLNRSRVTANDFAPITWNNYFDSYKEVKVNGDSFHCYIKDGSGPLLVTIHGGGYSALTWALFARDVSTKIDCQLLAIDLRGHGKTKTDKEYDLSLEQLSEDVLQVIQSIYAGAAMPKIILIGHSLGGAVVVEVASKLENLAGVCVIDVVEGTALDSLSGMQSILRGRPSGFKSISHAVQWGFRGGSTQNLEAARVSMPGQIINVNNGLLAADEIDSEGVGDEAASIDFKPIKAADSIQEETEDAEEGDTASMKPPLPGTAVRSSCTTDEIKYSWRIDLTKTEQHWPGWFKGLSQKFLSINAPKILLLANIYGLDTALTVGQMQGKFQLQVLPRSGHAIHEDQPEQVADIIATFLVRQKLANSRQGFVPIVPGC